jgi:dihydrofolate reductase
MRKLIASTFASLDGILQAPGGPEEDPTGGFTLGGWMFDYLDDTVDISASGFDGKDRELVLGRRTYQIFEAYWPYQPDGDIARTLNAAKKHVASRTLTMLHWNNSALLHGDVVSAIKALKAQSGPDLQIIGSGNLIQTLQAASLIDEYNVWTFPVVLGRGSASLVRPPSQSRCGLFALRGIRRIETQFRKFRSSRRCEVLKTATTRQRPFVT